VKLLLSILITIALQGNPAYATEENSGNTLKPAVISSDIIMKKGGQTSYSAKNLIDVLNKLILSYFPQLQLTSDNNNIHAAYKTRVTTRKYLSKNTMPQVYRYKQVEEPEKNGILIKVSLSEKRLESPWNYLDTSRYQNKSEPHFYCHQEYSKKYNCYILAEVYYYRKSDKDFHDFLNSFNKLIVSFENFLQSP
jgi:hypothetical protein